jgi:hypothetical protein
MARLRYDVTKIGEHNWTVRFAADQKYDGKDYGSYRTQEAAQQQAVAWAKEQHAKGHDSQVYTRNEQGQFRLEWTYGHDPRRSAG